MVDLGQKGEPLGSPFYFANNKKKFLTFVKYHGIRRLCS